MVVVVSVVGIVVVGVVGLSSTVCVWRTEGRTGRAMAWQYQLLQSSQHHSRDYRLAGNLTLS